MLTEIKESDWKVLRRMHPLALERFCARVLRDLEQAAHDSSRSLHQRYLEVYRLIQQRNLQMARLFDDPKRSRALSMLAQMRGDRCHVRSHTPSPSPRSR